MSAIARLLATCCTALPIQRWLGGIALACLAIALLGFAIGVRALAVLVVIAGACYVLAIVMFAGYFFRVMAAPRTHRFLPHFRGKSLAAFLLLAAVTIGPCLAAFLLVPPDGRGPMLVFVFVLSVCLLFPFLPTEGYSVVLLLIPAFGLIGRSIDQALETSGGSAAGAIAAAWAVAWAAFAVWYLRAPPLGPLRFAPLIGDGKLGRRLFSDTSGVFERSSATTALLTSAYPLRMRHRLLTLAFVALLSTYVAWLALHSAPKLPGALVIVILIVVAPLMFAPLANRAARRAKHLWLKSGKSRGQLFAITERQLWRTSFANAFGVSLTFCAIVALSFEVPLRALIQAVALGLTGTAFAVYLGLIWGSRLLEFAVSAPLGASVLAAALSAAVVPERSDLLVSIGAVQVVGALIARAVASRRWRRIDWLQFRPVRIPFQSLRGDR